MPLLFELLLLFYDENSFSRIVYGEVEAQILPSFDLFQGIKKPRNYPWFFLNYLKIRTIYLIIRLILFLVKEERNGILTH